MSVVSAERSADCRLQRRLPRRRADRSGTVDCPANACGWFRSERPAKQELFSGGITRTRGHNRGSDVFGRREAGAKRIRPAVGLGAGARYPRVHPSSPRSARNRTVTGGRGPAPWVGEGPDNPGRESAGHPLYPGGGAFILVSTRDPGRDPSGLPGPQGDPRTLDPQNRRTLGGLGVWAPTPKCSILGAPQGGPENQLFGAPRAPGPPGGFGGARGPGARGRGGPGPRGAGTPGDRGTGGTGAGGPGPPGDPGGPGARDRGPREPGARGVGGPGGQEAEGSPGVWGAGQRPHGSVGGLGGPGGGNRQPWAGKPPASS
jgi:hypothetical protein